MKRNRLITSLLAIAIVFSTMSTAFAFDEGMFMPDQIATLPLKKLGLKIKPTDIYNPAGGGLTDAVIRLSIGCSAEFVSPQGLILTNHHCGFDALVSASTPEKDLVETGFRTDGRSGEIPAKGYSIFVTQRSEDVTAKVKAGTDGLSGDALATATKKNLDALQVAEQAKAPAGSIVRIQMLNSGYFYYLIQTQQVKDVRVVYAPPRNIGIFGGDPDNFEWTRHTGDFTFLRAYTAPDGSSAEYSANNVPMKTKKFLALSIGGLKDNDFVFVLGYPGSTTRYRESQSIEYARDANFPFLEKWLNALSTSLRQIGATDEEKRIAFQSDIASFDNSRKAFGGGYLRLRKSGVVQARQAEEARLATWIAANPDRQKKYGSVLADIKALSADSNAAMMRDAIMRRFPDPNSMNVFVQIVSAAATVKAGRKLTAEQKTVKLAEINEALKDREPAHEREMLKFFFKSFDGLPTGQRFAAADTQFGNKTGKARREAEAAFAAEIADSSYDANMILGLYSLTWSELQAQHPFATGVVDERTALAARSAKFAASIDPLRLEYMQAMIEMKGMTAYPDANSTLRFSYGNVKGYASREAEYRSPFTTMKGMFEKETGENPFDVPQKLKDLNAAKDFGRWGSGDTVAVNFISTTDIIGGNSGSPILNGNGEQVGICFDGNFEGLGNDFYYDPAVNRTISVDIRYVLFVVEKFGGAGWMLDEMNIVGGKK
ncbi:MAG TPA: S46 family peptidase [Pyrinomonadaceae bacterium]|nr:S46 family peptidase [Chloracidobacterium sp.]MBP9935236.1 S46 family peptidase [Pyrinomonadaceae bacterium]MBL0240855.1 S46 family peptidase [Chloracidobacterium sp.]HQX55997.1 S46 family peptidase [Pyrinomonadaceae bacterium]HQY66103.1 S46 family peptidase [Pyrinomonadaceae bacterium]